MIYIVCILNYTVQSVQSLLSIALMHHMLKMINCSRNIQFDLILLRFQINMHVHCDLGTHFKIYVWFQGHFDIMTY